MQTVKEDIIMLVCEISHAVTPDMIDAFAAYLRREERMKSTIDKYTRDTRSFFAWLDGNPVTKEAAVAWKEYLLESGTYASATVNTKIAAINAFFKFAGWEECHVKALRLQRQMFREADMELTQAEYKNLVDIAYNKGKVRLALVMETLGATGIRVSELQYVTAEAVEKGSTNISLKGKIRSIILPGKLRKKLRKYIRKNKIASGEIFLTRSGKGLSRSQIWS